MGILKTKTVDSIMSAFTKTISDLEAVEKANADDAAQMREQAELLQQEANLKAREASRANTIANNLKNLVAAG